MFVLGTVGHVDHGKSSLLKLLTGEDSDRLPEEKRRGMTIDLNFVSLRLASGMSVGIVDVPGHERFLKNMISGVSGMDAFLFVVAADDGWMPQSEEHLRILMGLGVRFGIGVITKIDVVTPERAEEIRAEVSGKLRTAFERPVQTVLFSVHDPGSAIDVRRAIEDMVKGLPPPRDIGNARVWVDRVFTPKGQGVVVTGTLRDGRLQEEDKITFANSGKIAIVKSLQCYHTPVKSAAPVSRLAIQLSRVQSGDVKRGDLLELHPNTKTVAMFDASVDLFSVPKRAVQASIHLGTGKFSSLMIPMGAKKEKLSFCRFKLEDKIPIRSGDPFIIRTSGDEKLLGSGCAVDLHPLKSPHRLALKGLSHWSRSVAGLIEFLWEKDRVVSKERYSLSVFPWKDALEVLEPSVWWIHLKETFAIKKKDLHIWSERLQAESSLESKILSEASLLTIFCKQFGVLPQTAKYSLPFWIAASGLKKEGLHYKDPRAEVVKTPNEVLLEKKIMEVFSKEGAHPVNFSELLKNNLWRSTVSQMVAEGALVLLAENHYLTKVEYDAYRQKVETYLKQKSVATTSDLRAHLDLSRKHVVFVLERLDRDRITYLKDGVRKLLRA